jgi:hypothetical protein
MRTEAKRPALNFMPGSRARSSIQKLAAFSGFVHALVLTGVGNFRAVGNSSLMIFPFAILFVVLSPSNLSLAACGGIRFS